MLDCRTDNNTGYEAEWHGEKDVLCTLSTGGRPMVLARQVKLPAGKPKLSLLVSSHPQGKWKLQVRVNGDELIDLIEYGKTVNAEVRFIEYMDVGGATRWSPARVVSRREMLDQLAGHYGPIQPVVEDSSAPADRFTLPDGTVFGIISSTTDPFCRNCDRSRLTADGVWYLCLYAARGIDLRGAVRRGASVDELKELISAGWRGRDDRGAEARLAMDDRRGFVPLNSLRQDPHLEMHTRGG